MFSDITFSSNQLLLFVFGCSIALITIIALIRFYISRKMNSGLTEYHKGESFLKSRNKYPEVDVFKYRDTLLMFGFVMILGLLTALFNWTTIEAQVEETDDFIVMMEDVEVEPPRTAEPPPPPPPPPVSIEEVPEEFIEEEDEVEFVDQSIEEESEVIAPPPPIEEPKAPPPPPPPPPMQDEADVEEIFKIVEEMPRFPGCEDVAGTKNDIKACADRKLMEFIYQNIKYPTIARENGIQGTVVIQFVVEKDGSIGNASVVRDIGGSCGEESLRVVNLMKDLPKKWTPGKQRAKAVRVRFNLPVKFKLENL